jgi:hypothetical protein
MIEFEEETESKVVFDTDEEYSFMIRRSAYKNLWADASGNVYRLSSRGGMSEVNTYINNAGYLICSVINNGKSTTVPVQRIVATAWIPNPQHLSDVDHKDDNKLNNSVDNLQWLSRRDNLIKHHRMAVMSGQHNFCHGRAVLKVISDGTTKFYKSLSEAAKDNGLSFSSVRGSANHQLSLDRPYYFEFAQSDKQEEA